jgi:hypothetical protein
LRAPCLTIRPSRRTGTAVFGESDLLRRLFETAVERCMAEGLVGGEGFAVDANQIRADANRQTKARAAKACRPKRTIVPFASIWPRSTMPNSSSMLSITAYLERPVCRSCHSRRYDSNYAPAVGLLLVTGRKRPSR